MFSKSVIGSARFLRMPASSRLLYYDLGMQADDDGIVEAFAVMRTTGATEDDLRVLASREFIRVLNDDLVSYITDWKRNNLIKKDRYQPSAYHSLLVQIGDGTQLEPEWNPSGTQAEPQVRLLAAFRQAYGIDLYHEQGRLHWLEFLALLSGIPQNTRLSEVMEIRACKVPPATKNNHEQVRALMKAKAKYAIHITEEERQARWQAGLQNIAKQMMSNAKEGEQNG